MNENFKRAATSHYLRAQIIFWGSYCLLNIAFIGLWGIFSIFFLAIFLVLSILLGLASHGLRYLAKNYASDLSFGRIFLHLLWLLPVIALVTQALLHALIYGVVTFFPATAENATPATIGSFFGYSMNTAIMLLLWSIIYLLRAEFFKRRHAEIEHWRLQAEIKERELDFLRSQINSHFLFNAINNLRALIREDAERARSGLADLSVLLRGILHNDNRTLVKLHEELEWVRGYFALEALQFEDRLTTEEFIDPNLLNAQLPPLLLQTLAENAIKHGIAARRGGGKVTITARKLDSTHWELRVTNPLPEFQASHTGNGVGLQNAHERLTLAFGDQARLTLELTDQACAQVVMPL
jgi:LytS/YehU family sensor histidine kinase